MLNNPGTFKTTPIASFSAVETDEGWIIGGVELTCPRT